MDKKRKTLLDNIRTRLTLAFVLLMAALLLEEVLSAVGGAMYPHWAEALTSIALASLLVYGNVGVRLARIGRLALRHESALRKERGAVEATVAVQRICLVPSYGNALRVKQSLITAALEEQPGRRVVLSIDAADCRDDPQQAQAAVTALHHLVAELDSHLRCTALRFLRAHQAFAERCGAVALDLAEETAQVGQLYLVAAGWFEQEARQSVSVDYTDRFFIETVLLSPARSHRTTGEALLLQAERGIALDRGRIMLHQERLAGLFRAELTTSSAPRPPRS